MINFLIQNGAPYPDYTITLLLMLPIAITAVVVGRQIIGIKGFGIATPVFIAYACVATGLSAGIIIFFAALGAGFVVKSALKNVRLLYLPKMALILTGVTITVLLLLEFIPYPDEIQFPQAVFSLLIFIISTEQFASFLIERGSRKTLGIVFETLATAAVIFFLITWPWLQNIVLSYFVFTFIAVVLINLFLGKWTGLRISEYIRFKDIISK